MQALSFLLFSIIAGIASATFLQTADGTTYRPAGLKIPSILLSSQEQTTETVDSSLSLLSTVNNKGYLYMADFSSAECTTASIQSATLISLGACLSFYQGDSASSGSMMYSNVVKNKSAGTVTITYQAYSDSECTVTEKKARKLTFVNDGSCSSMATMQYVNKAPMNLPHGTLQSFYKDQSNCANSNKIAAAVYTPYNVCSSNNILTSCIGWAGPFSAAYYSLYETSDTTCTGAVTTTYASQTGVCSVLSGYGGDTTTYKETCYGMQTSM